MSVSTDIASVLTVLRVRGPVTSRQLGEELPGWSWERLERAVAAAWTRSLISLDPEDRLLLL